MTVDMSSRPKIVILGPAQDFPLLEKAVKSQGFEAVCAVSASECLHKIDEYAPQIIVHNLRSYDPSQTNILHQRMVKQDSAARAQRVLLAPEVSTPVLALASDCGLRKVIQLAAALSNFSFRLEELQKENATRSESQSLVHTMRMIAWGEDAEFFDKAVEEAYAVHPHDMIVRLEYGYVCLRKGKFSEARSTALRIVQLEPHNVRAMSLLARAEYNLGNKDAAFRLLDAADKTCPHNPDRLNFLGDVLKDMGKSHEAKEKYLASLAVYPKSSETRERLAACSLTELEMQSALDLLAEPSGETDRASFLNRCGVNAINQKRFDDALKLYDSALNSLTNPMLKASVLYNLGLAYRKGDKFPEALQAFEQCLQQNPKHPNASIHIKDLSKKILD